MNLIFICYNIKLIEKKHSFFFKLLTQPNTHTHIYIYIYLEQKLSFLKHNFASKNTKTIIKNCF